MLPLPSGAFVVGLINKEYQTGGRADGRAPNLPCPLPDLSLPPHGFADSIQIEPPESADPPRRDVAPPDCASDGMCADAAFCSQLFDEQQRGSHDAPFSVEPVDDRIVSVECAHWCAVTIVPLIDRLLRPVYFVVYIQGGKAMKTANVFMSRHSHAVRVLKEFQLEGDEVKIQKQENVLVLRPKNKSWAALIESLKKFTDDCMAKGRRQPPLQKRGRAFA